VNVESSVPSFGLGARTKVKGLIPAKLAHHHRRFVEWFGSLSGRNKVLFIGAVVTVLALLAAGAAYVFLSPGTPDTSSKTTKKAKAVAPAPKTVASKLTGLQVDPSINERAVIGVMIENSTEARPQSGLDQAGVVFEAEAEGGITRFLALFQDEQPDYLGPVRSARPYYVQWCQGFDCAYVHVGGSPEALQSIKDWGIKDLNQFAGGSYFDRISSRAAPHNVYTSLSKLTDFANSRGYTSSNYSGFDRLDKEGKFVAGQTVANAINIEYPGTKYDVHYDYDAASNSYKRSEAGEAHNVVDASGTTTQITPKVVIVLATAQSSNGKYSVYQVEGSGEVNIFENGTVIHGTWSKPTAGEQITFSDDSGAPLKLNPGQTWISVVGSLGSSNYN
jgi:hypothetical protein